MPSMLEAAAVLLMLLVSAHIPVGLAQVPADVNQLLQDSLAAPRTAGQQQLVVPLQQGNSSLAPQATQSSITIPSNTSLLIQGIDSVSSSLAWQLPGNSTVLELQSGAVLTLADMTLTVSQPLPPSALSGDASGLHWAELLSLPGLKLQPGSMLQLVNMVVVLPNCSILAAYQDVVCAAAQTPELELFYAPRVRPGRILFVNMSGDGSLQHMMANVSMTCAAALPTLRVDLPGFPPANASDPAVLQLRNLSTQLGPTACLIRQVRSAARLLDDLQQAAHMVQHGGLLVLQITANVSLSEVVWPAEGVYLTNDICLVGPPMGPDRWKNQRSQGVELDIAGIQNFLVLDQDLASMSINNLCITNLPLGDDAMFPKSLIVSAMWAVKFNRPAANRTMLLFRNSQLVVPADLFSYISYWVGLQASTVPNVLATADWLRDIVYFGATLGGADKHSLLFYRRQGQGTFWINSTLTDMPYKTPLMMAATGISDLVPDQGPLVPLTKVRPVYNATHLASVLCDSNNTATHLVVMKSMQLTEAILQPCRDQAITSSSNGNLVVSSPLTIIGRPPATITGRAAGLPQVLDLGGIASLISVAVPQGTRFTIQRLTLTGLGPYPVVIPVPDSNDTYAGPSPPLLGNLTCALWAFDFPRRQSRLHLLNTTLVVSAYELAAINAALGHPASISTITTDASIDPSLPPVQSDALQTIGNAFSMVDDHVQPAGSMLILNDVAFLGIEGIAVTLTARLPPLAALPSMTVPRALLLTSTPTSKAASSNSTEVLGPGGVVAIVVGSVTLLVVTLLVAWGWQRCLRTGRANDAEQHDKTASVRTGALDSLDSSPSDTGSMPRAQPRMAYSAGQASLDHTHASPHARTVQSAPSQFAGDTTIHTHPSIRSQRAGESLVTSKVSHAMEGFIQTETEASSQNERLSYGAELADTGSDAIALDLPATGLQPALHTAVANQHAAGHMGQPLSTDSWARVSPPPGPGETIPLRRGTTKLECTGPTLMQVAQEAVSLTRRLPAEPCADANPQAGVDAGGLMLDTGKGDAPDATAMLAKPKLGKENLDLNESAGSGKGAAGAEGVTKRPVFEQGLAAGDEECEPELLLQQVIAHRKEIQGVDMQQIEFQQILGQGSFGVVYKGKWRSLTVAIKTLLFHDAATANRVRQRAITEAAINTLLTHNNIINTFSYELRPVAPSGMPEEKHTAYWKLYIIQEYCDGGSLAQAVDRGLFMDPRTGRNNMLRVLQVARDIAQGMAYIHANNVIHGDLSAGNILLRHEQGPGKLLTAKVGDFGLSRFLEGPDHSHISNAHQGTPFYMAPEVLSRGIISQSADVFSFGVLLWEMFCGTPPWRDSAGPGLQNLNPQTFPYHVPVSCPVEYHEIIMACLAENPKARPRFASLVERISNLLLMLKEAITALLKSQQQASQQQHQELQGGPQWQQQRLQPRPLQQPGQGQQQQQQQLQQQQQQLQLKVQQKWQQLTQAGAITWRPPQQQTPQQPGQPSGPLPQGVQQAVQPTGPVAQLLQPPLPHTGPLQQLPVQPLPHTGPLQLLQQPAPHTGPIIQLLQQPAQMTRPLAQLPAGLLLPPQHVPQRGMVQQPLHMQPQWQMYQPAKCVVGNAGMQSQLEPDAAGLDDGEAEQPGDSVDQPFSGYDEEEEEEEDPVEQQGMSEDNGMGDDPLGQQGMSEGDSMGNDGLDDGSVGQQGISEDNGMGNESMAQQGMFREGGMGAGTAQQQSMCEGQGGEQSRRTAQQQSMCEGQGC